LTQYNAKKEWERLYGPESRIAYPAEGVIRILKGTFPTLSMPKPTEGNILDLGCGDGRHFPLFAQSDLDAFGIEISNEICTNVSANLSKSGIPFENIKTGTADNIPYDDSYFDYLLTWNSCYYMSATKSLDFSLHVDEMSRVLKKDAWIIASIPKKTSFIFNESIPHDNPGYQIIAKDPFNLRNGEILKCFDDCRELEDAFSKRFYSFSHADINMSWFGLNYHWHVFVAQKK